MPQAGCVRVCKERKHDHANRGDDGKHHVGPKRIRLTGNYLRRVVLFILT